MNYQANVAVIILTLNEEQNLPQALDSVRGWAREVFIVDSFSTDATIDIGRRYACHIVQHPFSGYATQRNFALDALPISAEWIFFLDADEWLPDALKAEIVDRLETAGDEFDGFLVNRRLLWMGRWIKRGYYPVHLLRLFRRGKGRCEAREINEHIVVDGRVGELEHDMIHEDHKSVTEWVEKHNRYAAAEAQELVRAAHAEVREGRLLGNALEQKRWLRSHVWNRLPPLLRPVAYFGYRYVLRGGFLDGREALAFHVLQGLWLQTLIDVKYLELMRGTGRAANR